MLAGPWGSGKTTFLKAFLDKRAEPHLFVSLYGVRSVADIEDQFFRQLHPILSSKALRLGSLVLKAVARGALKFDLDGAEANIEGRLPDIKVKEFTENPKGRLLIFDDLERCPMPASEVLGYINAFVEHEGIKAIILANDGELDRNNADFKRIREKLIGQTLVVTPSARVILSALHLILVDPWTIEFVEKHANAVLDIFAKSATQNLRVLKQSLWDFEKLARTLRSTDRTHEDALVKIMQALIAQSIETRVGRLSESDVRQVGGLRWRQLLGKDKDPPTALDEADDRYEGVDLRQPYVDPDLFADLLFKGWLDAIALAKSLDRQAPFIPPDQEPAWRRAWYASRISDADYNAALTETQADFSARKEVNPHVFFHAFGVLLRAARIRAITPTPSNIAIACKAYIDDLLRTGRLVVPSIAEEHWIGNDFDGLEYTDVKSAEFKQLKAYYARVIDKARHANLASEAAELVDLMASDTDAFVVAICLGEAHSVYWRTPILHASRPEHFADTLLSLPPRAQYRVFHALNRRYTTPQDPPGLQVELVWLRRLRAVLEQRRRAMQPLSRSRLGDRLDEYIKPVLLTKAKPEPNAPTHSL
jgi:hypothetical protein